MNVESSRDAAELVPLRDAIAELRQEAQSAYTMTERLTRECYLKGQMDMADAILKLYDLAEARRSTDTPRNEARDG